MPLDLKQEPPYYDITDVLPNPSGLPTGTKIYTALMTQVGTNAPTAQILQNTIGAIVWTRLSPGVYKGTLAGTFTLNKTVPTMGPIPSVINNPTWQIYREDADDIVIGTLLNDVYTDGELNLTPIQILIYP